MRVDPDESTQHLRPRVRAKYLGIQLEILKRKFARWRGIKLKPESRKTGIGSKCL